MNENPYGAPGEIRPRSVERASLALWLKRAGQLLKARLPLTAGITAMAVLLFAGGLNSCIGIFVLPHIAAGWAVAAFMLAGSAPAFDSLFQAFQIFGRVLVAGLYYIGMILAAGAVAALIVFVVFVLLVFWSKILGQQALTDTIDSMPSEDLGLIMIGAFVIVWLLMLGYPLARSQLAFVLIVTRGYSAPDAFRDSWRITAPFGLRLTIIRACAHTAVTVGLALCLIPGLLMLPYCLALRGVIARSLLDSHDGNAATPGPDTSGQGSDRPDALSFPA
jgi:hypothetical protein